MPESASLLDVLPHSQCQACGFGACAPFAEAVAEGRAEANGCSPGGMLVEGRLQRRLGMEPRPDLREALEPLSPPVRARIEAQDCIGCAKCLDACPVDAILGASRQLHVVLEQDCTGCGLCVPPCPVDCITLVSDSPDDWPRADGSAARRVIESAHADCVACGACGPACPEGLDPAALLRALQGAAWEPGTPPDSLAACTLCAACEPVCPSRIPLSAWFSQGKDIARAIARWEQDALRARTHHERRSRRLALPTRDRLPSLPPLLDLDAAAARAEIDLALARQSGAWPTSTTPTGE